MDNWNFDPGLTGWTKTGTAIDHQPTFGNNVTLSRGGFARKMPLGGTYWREVGRFPVIGAVAPKAYNWLGHGSTSGFRFGQTILSRFGSCLSIRVLLKCESAKIMIELKG